MTTPLLDLAAFKLLTPMPAEEVDAVEAKYAGFILRRLVVDTSRIYAQLFKRYQVPFVNPPEIVLGWLAAMTTPAIYRRRGWAPSVEQAEEIEKDRTDALAEIQLAADAVHGLFDLPLRADTNGDSAVTRGGVFGYAEPSPYDWMDVQAEVLRGR